MDGQVLTTLSFLGIVAHWSDEEYYLRSALIGLKDVQFSHAGTHFATNIMTVLEGYGILNKIAISRPTTPQK
jgi:hypothetical protein